MRVLAAWLFCLLDVVVWFNVGPSLKVWNPRTYRCFCNATEVAWGNKGGGGRGYTVVVLSFGFVFPSCLSQWCNVCKVLCQKRSSSTTRGRADSCAQMLLDFRASRLENEAKLRRREPMSHDAFLSILSRKQCLRFLFPSKALKSSFDTQREFLCSENPLRDLFSNDPSVYSA